MRSRFGCVWFFVTPRTVAHQAPQAMGLSRQEYWSELSCPPPGDLPDPGDRIRISCVSCIGRQVLYHCTTREVPSCSYAELLNARSRDNQVKTLISHLMKMKLRLNKSYEIQGIFLLKNVKKNLILNFNSFPFLIIILSCQDFDSFFLQNTFWIYVSLFITKTVKNVAFQAPSEIYCIRISESGGSGMQS